jgi:hypothetical protein
MRNFIFAIFVAAISTVVLANEAPVKMTKKELLAFLPGTHTTYTIKAGSLHRWTNEPDGKFVVSTNNKKYGSVLGVQNVTASGTWKVNDDGKYCITINWKREPEDWCAFVFKGKNGEYFLGGEEPSRRIEFVK